jgi:hypothetical protein
MVRLRSHLATPSASSNPPKGMHIRVTISANQPVLVLAPAGEIPPSQDPRAPLQQLARAVVGLGQGAAGAIGSQTAFGHLPLLSLRQAQHHVRYYAGH